MSSGCTFAHREDDEAREERTRTGRPDRRGNGTGRGEVANNGGQAKAELCNVHEERNTPARGGNLFAVAGYSVASGRQTVHGETGKTTGLG